MAARPTSRASGVLGNRGLNLITNGMHGSRYNHLCYGYNAFWRKVLPVLDLAPGRLEDDASERRWGDGFEVETLINIRVHNAARAVSEVASFATLRLQGVSNLNAVSDGLRVLRTTLLERQAMRRGDRLRDLVHTVVGEPAESALEVAVTDAIQTPDAAATTTVIDPTEYERPRTHQGIGQREAPTW